MCLAIDSSLCPRQRDLFPLPAFSDFLDSQGSGQSECAKRRALKRDHVGTWCEEIGQTLNEMCGAHHPSMHAGRPTMSQRLAMGHICHSVRGVGQPPEGQTGRAALRELLAKQGYGGGATVELDMNLLSLPSTSLTPVALDVLMGDGGHHFVQDFISSAVLPKMAARAKIAECDVKTAYMDPGLRSDPVRFGRLLERLHAAGMIEFRTSGVPRCGLFAVHKKGGKQRLIVDARISNCCFTDSKPVHLCTGATLGSVVMEEGERLYVGQVDIENAFCNMLLPECLVDFFCLPRIKARHTGTADIGGSPVTGDTWLYPH